MALLIEHPGMMSTLQGAPRIGHRAFGVGLAGPMDALAAAMANVLCGNQQAATVIEVVQGGFAATAQSELLLATGGTCVILIDGCEIPSGRAFILKPGQQLEIRRGSKGIYSYLAIAGGWAAEVWLGSTSTDGFAGKGGFQGSTLQKGNLLKANEERSKISMQMHRYLHHKNRTFSDFAPAPFSSGMEEHCIRYTRGSGFDWLTNESKEVFQNGSFLLSTRFNRMGYAFHGPRLHTLPGSAELLSSAVMPGTIQCTPDGNLYLLMADAQTSGGYPVPGIVIQADLPRCAALKPGAKVNFQEVTVGEARKAYAAQLDYLKKLDMAVSLRANALVLP